MVKAMAMRVAGDVDVDVDVDVGVDGRREVFTFLMMDQHRTKAGKAGCAAAHGPEDQKRQTEGEKERKERR